MHLRRDGPTLSSYACASWADVCAHIHLLMCGGAVGRMGLGSVGLLLPRTHITYTVSDSCTGSQPMSFAASSYDPNPSGMLV